MRVQQQKAQWVQQQLHQQQEQLELDLAAIEQDKNEKIRAVGRKSPKANREGNAFIL